MNIVKQVPLCIILFVIFVSGCTTTTNTVELGDGVVMLDYDIEFSDVYAEECVDIGILVKNKGSVEAKRVFVELLGIEQDWYGEGEPWGRGCKSQNGGTWTPGHEKTANEPECRWQPEEDEFNLLPPDPVMGTDGETHTCTWTYKAPEIPEQADITYKATLRIFYQYQTDVVKAVTLMTQEEMKNLMEQGKTLPVDTQSSTRSPVKVDVKTSTPLRMYADKVEFPVIIEIENIGGGFTCVGYSSWDNGDNIKECRSSQQSTEKSAWRRIKIEMEPDDIIKLSECDNPTTLTLYKGKSNTITCKATVLKNDLPSQRIQAMIKISAKYHYIIDNDLEITVHGSVG